MGNRLLKIAMVVLGSWCLDARALDNPANFNFDGVLTNSGTPMAGPVNIKFQVYNPAANCLLYEEDHSAVALDTAGAFSLKVGSGTRASVGVDGGVAWKVIMANNGTVKNTATAGCSPGYVPAANDGRLLRVTVNGSTVLSPDFAIGAVPFATTADTLQGLTPADFVSATTPIIKAYNGAYYVGISAPSLAGNLNFVWPNNYGTNTQVLTTDGAGNLSWSTPAGGGLSTSGGAMTGAISMGSNDITSTGHIVMSPQKSLGLGVFSSAQETTLTGALSGPDTGKMWFNSTMGKMMYWDGTSAKAVLDAASNPWTFSGGNTYVSSGNVGVGTTNPTNRLHVENPAGIAIFANSGSSNAIYASSSGSNAAVDVSNSNGGGPALYSHHTGSGVGVIAHSVIGTPFVAWTGASTEVFRISSTGKVGVGTSTPMASLDINASDAIKIPTGTTAQRPGTPVAGMVRFNTDEGTLEAYRPPLGWRSIEPEPYHGIEQFATSGSFTVPQGIRSVKVIVIGGGGGGCTSMGSGGGGAAYVGYVNDLLPGDVISVTVGTGGSTGTNGSAGANSQFGPYVTAYGGNGCAGGSQGSDGGSSDMGGPTVKGFTNNSLRSTWNAGMGGAMSSAGTQGIVIVEY